MNRKVGIKCGREPTTLSHPPMPLDVEALIKKKNGAREIKILWTATVLAFPD